MAGLHSEIKTRLRSFDLDLSLAVEGETLALVGPSGSGKTTVLRCIAGLHRPDAGRIQVGERRWFDGARGIDLAPEERSVGMVFQDYALFPHMSVRDNVGFGGAGQADEMLRRLRIDHLAGERPGKISGGERQRVALARALSSEPDVLLLDEPLSALDPHTRSLLRQELRDTLVAAGLPTVLVTHDFREAAALSQRIAVISEGRLLQVGTAQELVARPADALVAALTGATVVAGVASPDPEGGSTVALAGGQVLRVEQRAEGPVQLAVLPWLVGITPGGVAGGWGSEGEITGIVPEGIRTLVVVGAIRSEQPADAVERLGVRVGQRVWLDVPSGAVRVLAESLAPGDKAK